jgi:hypothetical protein
VNFKGSFFFQKPRWDLYNGHAKYSGQGLVSVSKTSFLGEGAYIDIFTVNFIFSPQYLMTIKKKLRLQKGFFIKFKK